MGLRDWETNLGLPEELGQLVEMEASSRDKHVQEILREAVRDRYRELELEGSIDERIAALEHRLEQINEEIDDHRSEISELQEECLVLPPIDGDFRRSHRKVPSHSP